MWTKPKSAVALIFNQKVGLQSVAVCGDLPDVTDTVLAVIEDDTVTYVQFQSADVGKYVRLMRSAILGITAILEVDTVPDVVQPSPLEIAQIQRSRDH